MKQKKRKKRNNRLIKILIFLMITCFVYSIAPNYEKKQQNQFSILYDNEDRTSQIIYQDKIKQREIYLEMQDVQNLFGQDIYIDETNQWIVTVTKNKVVAINIENPIMEINSVEIGMNQRIIKEENKYYIPLFELKKVYNIDIEYIEEKNKVVIDLKDKELISADVNKKVKVKEKMKTFSTAIETIKKGESVIWISNDDEWAKIRTKNGNIGYVKQKDLTNFYTIRENMESNISDDQTAQKTINIKELKKINSIKLDNINEYKARQETIGKIVDQCVLEQVDVLELQNTTLQEQDEISYNRFKRELQAMLAEVGIQLK